jgi:hypothetical protein
VSIVPEANKGSYSRYSIQEISSLKRIAHMYEIHQEELRIPTGA